MRVPARGVDGVYLGRWQCSGVPYLRAAVGEELDDVGMAARRGDVHGGGALVVPVVVGWVGAAAPGVEDDACHFRVASEAGLLDGRQMVLVRLCEVGTHLDGGVQVRAVVALDGVPAELVGSRRLVLPRYRHAAHGRVHTPAEALSAALVGGVATGAVLPGTPTCLTTD